MVKNRGISRNFLRGEGVGWSDPLGYLSIMTFFGYLFES